MFFWASGSGCSCNWIWDDIYRVEDFEFGSRDELIGAVRRKYGNAYRKTPDLMLADIAIVKQFSI